MLTVVYAARIQRHVQPIMWARVACAAQNTIVTNSGVTLPD